MLDSSTKKKDVQVPPKTNVDIKVQVPIDEISTFVQQEEKFQQEREDLEGELDVKVDFYESATVQPFTIHEDLQVDEVQKVDIMV